MNRLSKIEEYAQRKTFEKEKEREIYEKTKKELMSKITELQSRITSLLEIANACDKNGISVSMLLNENSLFILHNPDIVNPKSKYEIFEKILNRKKNQKIASRPYNSISVPIRGVNRLLIGNNGEFYEYCSKNYRNDDRYTEDRNAKILTDCEFFLANFDQFEADFYAYVDQIIEESTRDEEQEL